jgi:hypothetical protein
VLCALIHRWGGGSSPIRFFHTAIGVWNGYIARLVTPGGESGSAARRMASSRLMLLVWNCFPQPWVWLAVRFPAARERGNVEGAPDGIVSPSLGFGWRCASPLPGKGATWKARRMELFPPALGLVGGALPRCAPGKGATWKARRMELFPPVGLVSGALPCCAPARGSVEGALGLLVKVIEG